MTDHLPSDSDPFRAGGEGDLTDSFWGDDAGWATLPPAQVGSDEVRRGNPISRWWESATAGRTRAATARTRPRVHGGLTPGAGEAHDVGDRSPNDTAPLDDRHLTDPADDWSDDWDAPIEPPRSGVDPLLARLGGLAVALTLLVPVVMGFASDSSGDDDLVRTAPVPSTAGSARTDPPPLELAAPAAEGSATSPPSTSTASAPTTGAGPTIEQTAPPTSAAAESLTTDTCGQEYDVVAGDFWIRIAEGSGVDVADLLAVNDATDQSPLYPGSSICLPAGASTPSPPVTEPPAASASGTASSSGGTGSSTDGMAQSGASQNGSAAPKAPSTTANAPTTTAAPAPPPAPDASAAEVEAIIREVWPDELEEKALQIAWRESNYRPSAKNACCYGVFQVYWSVHRAWLGDIGITSADQLYDPTLNARAAFALYERAGGWGPWGG